MKKKIFAKIPYLAPDYLVLILEQGCHEVFALESLNVVLTMEAFEE